MGPLRFRPGPGPRLLSGPGLTDGAGLVVQALRCQCDPGPLTSGSQKVWTLPSLPSPKGTPRAPGLLGEPHRVWKSPRRPFCPGPALPESAGSLCAAGPTEESPVPAWAAGLGTASQERPTPPPPATRPRSSRGLCGCRRWGSNQTSRGSLLQTEGPKRRKLATQVMGEPCGNPEGHRKDLLPPGAGSRPGRAAGARSPGSPDEAGTEARLPVGAKMAEKVALWRRH